MQSLPCGPRYTCPLNKTIYVYTDLPLLLWQIRPPCCHFPSTSSRLVNMGLTEVHRGAMQVKLAFFVLRWDVPENRQTLSVTGTTAWCDSRNTGFPEDIRVRLRQTWTRIFLSKVKLSCSMIQINKSIKISFWNRSRWRDTSGLSVAFFSFCRHIVII